MDSLNGIDLGFDSPSSFGRKCCPLDHGTKEMVLNSRITELQSKIMEVEKRNSYLTSFIPTSLPLATSSPSQSSSDSSSNSSFIEETLNSMLGPINTKRAVANHCRSGGRV